MLNYVVEGTPSFFLFFFIAGGRMMHQGCSALTGPTIIIHRQRGPLYTARKLLQTRPAYR